jgi:DNA-binding response OmpR family regulator
MMVMQQQVFPISLGEFDDDAEAVILKNGSIVCFTKTEYKFIKILLPNYVVTIDRLLFLIGCQNHEGSQPMLERHMAHLRKKLYPHFTITCIKDAGKIVGYLLTSINGIIA